MTRNATSPIRARPRRPATIPPIMTGLLLDSVGFGLEMEPVGLDDADGTEAVVRLAGYHMILEAELVRESGVASAYLASG